MKGFSPLIVHFPLLHSSSYPFYDSIIEFCGGFQVREKVESMGQAGIDFPFYRNTSGGTY